MNETTITVTGRLVADPVLRATASGAPMATFRIATNARRPKAGGAGEYEDGPTSFFNVRAFRALGSNLVVSLKKGDPVLVSGTLEITEYDRQDGTRGTAGEIAARSVGHDLAWGVTLFRKVVRSSAGEGLTPDPRLQASTQGMVDLAQAAGEEAADTIDYDVQTAEGTVVDARTGEVKEAADRPAA